MSADTPNAGGVAPLLVDAKEAARLLGMSERTLWTLTEAGEIQCLRISATGRKRPRKLYEMAELHAFIERQLANSRGPVR